ncbi:hypothetical protein [Candidatus Galacturonibacter soehngenii]|uniref:Uncharacterized protein n=1 Tax=Candidatus Galacturonatibacter soehngenii TaxID=2307010 RepID=A0A7V7UCQ5_9FIRM|nr:hypothetical protein [Candidatus Galacturonibacter soehngenii]KAB1439702.1 hypothetical protein F7O84_04755 [Candidatus Galacturonibacter soehngenii]
MKYKHIGILVIFLLLFFSGILLILKSVMWNLGSEVSMNLAGSIISIFSGMVFIIEFLKKN